MTHLSPVAQAVLDAYQLAPIEDGLTAAAVLRAAAKQLREACANEECIDHPDDWLDDIATELEGADEPTFTPEEIEMIQAPWSYLQSQQEIENE